MSTTATAAATAARAGAPIPSLPPHDFATEADDPHVVVVDVRESDERVAVGSIAGAVHVPRGLLEFRADPGDPSHDPRLGQDRRVLVYCDDGIRSALAAASLFALGYERVAHLDGGVRAWSAACLPLVGRLPSPY